MGVRPFIDRKKVGCRSLIDANLEGQVGVNKFKLYLDSAYPENCLFSSPEHEVLMVSYCGQWLSVVRRRPSCVVRRASTFDVYTLETTFVT